MSAKKQVRHVVELFGATPAMLQSRDVSGLSRSCIDVPLCMCNVALP